MASGDTLPIAMSKDIAKDFSVSERIYPGEYVYYNGKFYVCKDRDKYETEPWNSSKFEEITVGEAMSDISEDIAGTYSAIDTLAYPGKYYVYNNRIYRRKDSGGSGDWDETKFDLLYPDGIGGDLWGLYQCLGGWFDASATYHKGQYVFRPSSGIYVLCYCCNVDTHTGAWNDDHFTQVQISDVLKNLNTDLAPAFDATLEYSAGAYVTYNGGLYRLTAAHATNETWANTSKVAVSVGDELNNRMIEDAQNPGCFYRMVGDEKEWWNPPMVANTRYRTTERYRGKPVYVYLMQIDNFTAATSKTYMLDGTGTGTYDNNLNLGAYIPMSCSIQLQKSSSNGGYYCATITPNLTKLEFYSARLDVETSGALSSSSAGTTYVLLKFSRNVSTDRGVDSSDENER